ncbi:hypothetical protein EMPS_09869 [Entomortierella parvispora]|uniref:Uncharacterized protein n=1 Tax=Entomortierella parvispora TaxID=205924 RepID=A0A9P3HJ36_9FUNG|nr:hypothetical protein EMPS_09869 [Entomortierella parvispora]
MLKFGISLSWIKSVQQCLLAWMELVQLALNSGSGLCQWLPSDKDCFYSLTQGSSEIFVQECMRKLVEQQEPVFDPLIRT